MTLEDKIVITCAPRIVDILEKEVINLGYHVIEKDRLNIVINGNMADCMALNLHLRTANKVLYHIKTFSASNPDKLYERLIDIPWERYFRTDGYISVNGYVKNDFIKDTRFGNLKTKDAIVDRLFKVKGRRPDAGPDQSKSVVYLHWKDQKASIYIDTSGETIAKHGYRKLPFKAPMSEALAAACILESHWNKNSPFINPMCGSGTIAIEAALLAINKAPGLMRDNFGFMHTNLYDPLAWQKLKKEAEDQIVIKPLKIYASDLSNLAINAAKGNAKVAGLEELIHFDMTDFRKISLPEENGVIMMNPEYGLRLGDLKILETTYSEIGDFFKTKCKGYWGYIFTGNLELAKKIGLKTKRRIEFFNAKLDARLLEYELYAGSKKNSKLNL